MQQKTLDLATKTIREIALEAPATTRVFEEYKIDYCCGGRRSIEDVCSAAGIDPKALMDRINAAASAQPASLDDVEHKRPSELIDHIIAEHHIFTARETERLIPLMEKVVSRHGENHPELDKLQEVFLALVASLIPHMRKEEMVLFPYIKTLEASKGSAEGFQTPHFQTVRNPISMMMADHDADGERLRQMRGITDSYKLPEGACPSFTALYAGLEELEQDLHRHIHLENNVLFPAAADLEGPLVSGLN